MPAEVAQRAVPQGAHVAEFLKQAYQLFVFVSLPTSFCASLYDNARTALSAQPLRELCGCLSQELVKQAKKVAGECLASLPQPCMEAVVAAVLLDVAPQGHLAVVLSQSARRPHSVVLKQDADSGATRRGRARVRPETHVLAEAPLQSLLLPLRACCFLAKVSAAQSLRLLRSPFSHGNCHCVPVLC